MSEDQKVEEQVEETPEVTGEETQTGEAPVVEETSGV